MGGLCMSKRFTWSSMIRFPTFFDMFSKQKYSGPPARCQWRAPL